jgi:hypothetical protein
MSDRSPRAAITFDLDGLARDPFPRPPTERDLERLQHLAFDVVVPRIIAWLDELNVRGTFFAIGADVERFPDAFASLARSGHEIASHTFAHPRDFSRMDPGAVRDDLERAHEAIASVTGVRPCGFRAPGYTISSTVIRVLTDLGYAYDASVVPSWLYSMIKKAYRVASPGKFGQYLIPQELACARAPRLPYRIAPGNCFAPSPDAALIEIPLTTIGAAQFPLIHGLSTRLPAAGQRVIARSALRQPFFSLAFHDLEFAERADFGSLPASGLTERHLRTPIGSRLAELTATVTRIKRTHRFLPLREVASAAMDGAAVVA